MRKSLREMFRWKKKLIGKIIAYCIGYLFTILFLYHTDNKTLKLSVFGVKSSKLFFVFNRH